MPSTAPHPPRDARQELANTITHAVGMVLSLGGAVALLASCTHWTIALACGYRSARRINSLDALRVALQEGGAGPRFLHVRTVPRPDRKLPRPTITPPEVAERLRGWLRGR